MKKQQIRKLIKKIIQEQINPGGPGTVATPFKEKDPNWRPKEPWQCGPGLLNYNQAQNNGIPMNACFPCETHTGPGGTYDYGQCTNHMPAFLPTGGGTTELFSSHADCIAHPSCVQHWTLTDDQGNVLTVGPQWAGDGDFYSTNIGYIDDEGNYQQHKPSRT